MLIHLPKTEAYVATRRTLAFEQRGAGGSGCPLRQRVPNARLTSAVRAAAKTCKVFGKLLSAEAARDVRLGFEKCPSFVGMDPESSA